MKDQIDFLRAKAAALRTLAQRAPQIGETLQRLADELDAKADGLERGHGGSPNKRQP